MKAIHTDDAPAALGTYSQGRVVGKALYTAGQIGLDPRTMKLEEGIDRQIRRVFENIRAICRAAGADLDRVAALTVYLTDVVDRELVNSIMGEYFQSPYPARTAIGVASLPVGALVEIAAVVGLEES
jgi:reactive intermediate/imine deaminase